MRARRLVVGTAVGLSLALVAGCAAPQPTMAEVLDGQATAQVRSAAVIEVEQWAQGLNVAGLSEVARQTYTTCLEGHYDLGVHDDFRLKCRAQSTVYFAWDGDYSAGRHAFISNLESICTTTWVPVGSATPSRAGDDYGPNYQCGAELRVSSVFASGRGPNLDKYRILSNRYDESRWVSGDLDADVPGLVKSKTWVLVLNVSRVFFQD